MLVMGDGRQDQDRACGLWHQGFAIGGGEDIDKYVSYNHVLLFFAFDKTQMDGKYCVGILYLFFICVMPSILESCRRNWVGSHLSSLRRVSR